MNSIIYLFVYIIKIKLFFYENLKKYILSQVN